MMHFLKAMTIFPPYNFYVLLQISFITFLTMCRSIIALLARKQDVSPFSSVPL